MPLTTGQASPSPAAAAPAGRRRTTRIASLLFLFLAGSAAAAAAAAPEDKYPPERAQAAQAPQHPSPLSLSRAALLAASRRRGANSGGSDRNQAGTGDSSPERQVAAQERATTLRVNHFGRRGLASTTSGSSSSDPGSAGGGGCSDDLLACAADRTCLSCIDGETVDVGECLETYHSSESDGGGERPFCQSLGSSFCCGSYEMYFESAVTCVDEDLVLAYWACSLESNGCSLDDLPCYGVNMTAILEAQREAVTTSEEETMLTSSVDVDVAEQNGSRGKSPAFSVQGAGVDGGSGGGGVVVVGGSVLYACVLGIATAAGWN